MRPERLWRLRPFVGSIVAILGLLLFASVVAVLVPAPACDVKLGDMAPPFPFPAARPPDLDIAEREPGYVASLGMAGRQLHFEDREGGRTWIAVEAWPDVREAPWRLAVAEYEGPPSRAVPPDLVRPIGPVLTMLVVRVAKGADIRWAHAVGGPRGPLRADDGAANLVVPPGKVTLWTGDGLRHEIDIQANETVWCSLSPRDLRVERRR